MAEITTGDLTNAIEGDGVFDEIMSTIRDRLDREYQDNRIRGADYSKVYLGAMEASMQQAVVFLLGRQKADKEADLIEEETKKVILEAALVAKQIEKIEAEICVLEKECENKTKEGLILDLEPDKIATEICIGEATCLKVKEETKAITQSIANAVKEGKILDEQDDKVIAETALIGKQHDKIDSEIKMTDQQVLNLIKEGVILDVQDDKVIAETGLINKQHSKLDSEIRMTDQQILNLQKEGVILDVQDDKVIAETTLITKQHEKIDSEIELTDQQVINLGKEGKILDVQDDKVVAETTLINKQHDKIDSEVKMTDQQVLNLVKEGVILDVQDDKVIAETQLILKQHDKIDADTDMIRSEITKNTYESQNLVKQGQLIDKQILKMTDEISLVKKQVIKTEMENLLLSVEGSVAQLQVLDNNVAWYNPLEGIWGTVEVTGTEINKRNQMNAQTALLNQQTANAQKENELLNQQKLKYKADTWDSWGSYYVKYAQLFNEVQLVDPETGATSGGPIEIVDGVIGAQRNKVVADAALVTEKLQTEDKQQLILDAQKGKINKEVELLENKRWTELAQVYDYVTPQCGGSPVLVSGLIGAKKSLYKKQVEGFDRDAEQKACKIVMDSWSVRKTVNEADASPKQTTKELMDPLLDKLINAAFD